MADRKRDILWRIYAAFFFICFFGVAVVVKAFAINAFEGEKWRALSAELSIRTMKVEAKRGSIYADDGRVLASSVPYFEVRIDFLSDAMTEEVFNENIESLAVEMAAFFGDKNSGQYLAELIKAREEGNRAYLVAKKVNYEELELIKSWEFFQLGRYKSGLVVTERSERKMPFGILAKRTIGYVGDGGQYKVGIEGAFDSFLKGTEGEILVQRLAGGTYKPIDEDASIAAIPGKNIHTTINITIQDVAENALLKTLEKHQADHGCVVVMEVKTGKIKAIVNIGSKADGSYDEIKNYAVWEATEPGSTFKAASMLALLEEGVVNKDDKVDLGDGTVKFYNFTMKDAHAPAPGEEVVTVQQVIEKSSNVGIAKLADGYFSHQPTAFYNHLENFGLLGLTGIEIKGEQAPVISSPSDWSGITIPWMSTGYELKLTPLQILSFYNAIANDGIRMKPYLVDHISEYDRVIEQFEPQVTSGKLASDPALEQLQEMLIGVVENGTARGLKNDSYSIAGKTGTSKIANESTNYADRVYQSSFVGYFPADKPIYSCIVVVNAPSQGIYYGSSVAAPVFKEIADKIYATSLQMHQSVDALSTDDPALLSAGGKSNNHDLMQVLFSLGHKPEQLEEVEFVSWSIAGEELQCNAYQTEEGQIPDVRGMGLKDAVYVLENVGLTVQIDGIGKVVSQSLTPGAPIQGHNQIKLMLN